MQQKQKSGAPTSNDGPGNTQRAHPDIRSRQTTLQQMKTNRMFSFVQKLIRNAHAMGWARKGHRSLTKCFQTMKSMTFACTRATLRQPNLSHMDCVGSPAAIHSSRTTSSKPTQSVSPNELINPEISKKKRRFSPFSSLGFGPAVFPGWVNLLMPVSIPFRNQLFEPHSFALSLPAFSLVAVLLFELVFWKEAS